MDGQPPAAAMDGASASIQDEVVELNRKFYMWISSSWEMCPHFCWNGAAEEYIKQINRILDSGSRGGSTNHAQTTGHRSSPNVSALHSPDSSSRPPFLSAPTTAAAALIPPTPAKSPVTQAHMPIASTSPVLPSASPPANRLRKRGAQGEHPDDPHAQGTARTGFSFGVPTAAAAPKLKPTATPYRASKPPTPDTAAAPVPAPPLFSSFGTSPKATSSSSSFGGLGSGTSAKPLGAPSTTPTFGALGASTAPSFGGSSTASFAATPDAASQPASSPSFSFRPASSGAEPKSPSLPLFGSMTAAGTSAASGAATSGGFSAGFSFSQPPGAKSTIPSFSFGPASGGTTTSAAASSAAFSFSSPAAGGFGSGGFGGGGTPTFNFGPSAPAAGENGSGTAADGDDEPQEKTEKVEIKGDDKTDITFSGKTSFRSKSDSGWGDPIVGLLTLRRDKASGRCWLQVNSETKGSIFVYGSIPSAAKFRTPEGKACVNMIVNIFRYPPGQEPKKTGDDGKGGKKQLEEKEDNPSSPKSVMIKTKTVELQSLVDALKEFGCQQI